MILAASIKALIAAGRVKQNDFAASTISGAVAGPIARSVEDCAEIYAILKRVDGIADAMAVVEALTEGPQVLVGSSMGGWISLLLARSLPGRVAGLVTVAAAPDFTERGFWAGFSELEQAKLMREGRLLRPSDYGEPYIITRKLIEDGRDHLLLQAPHCFLLPVNFVQFVTK